MNSVVEELKAYRIQKGISQQKLAELAGTSQPIISQIECGLIQPTIKMLTQIADALGKKISVK